VTSAIEKAISEDVFHRRRHGGPPHRCPQNKRVALGLLRANVDHLAHGKVRYVLLQVMWGVGIRKYSPPVTSVSDILRPYRRSLELHIELLDTLRTHDVSFETSRKTANTWVEQPCLEDDSWDVKWEALCEVEVDRWDSR
jgi:hypothetical protein